MKALIAMSGGVDSSVSAFLTLQKGLECIGATMRLYDKKDAESTCCSLEDVEDARSVAHRLGMLVNVIKHAEGDSEQRLRKIRPDLFTQNFFGTDYDMTSLYHTTLLEPTLAISDADFVAYYDALVQFWDQLPERMYTSD